MSKGEPDFTGLVQDGGNKARARTSARPSQAQKNQDNRAELALASVKEFSTKQKTSSLGDGVDFDLHIGEAAPAAAGAGGAGHFNSITDVADIERQMMADAPKEAEYKLEDVFDQSYKDMLKGGDKEKTVGGSIAAEGKEEEDEFDF